MRFRWKALALAPLAAPFIFSLVMSLGVKNPALAFLFFIALSSIFCYGVTIVLFIPALYCLSRLTRLQFYKVCLLGIFLGVGIFLPVSWVMYASSGPDSGPPEGTFLAYLWRSLSDPGTLLCPLAGLITAVTYWHFAKEPPPRTIQQVATQ